MNFNLSISSTGALTIEKKPNQQSKAPLDYNFLAQAKECQTAKQTIQFLKKSELDLQRTNYNHFIFVEKQESVRANSKINAAPCTLQKMIEQAESILQNNDREIKIHDDIQNIEDLSEVQEPWELSYSKDANKGIAQLPSYRKEKLDALLNTLKTEGPYPADQSHFEHLNKGPHIPDNALACHLNEGRPTYVACWTMNKKERKIKVFYVGSHEQAPYQK